MIFDGGRRVKELFPKKILDKKKDTGGHVISALGAEFDEIWV